MICSLCGKDFELARSKSACANCMMHKGCSLLKCPHCGYEMLPPSSLEKGLQKVINFFKRKKQGQ